MHILCIYIFENREYILIEFDSDEREAILRFKAKAAIPRQKDRLTTPHTTHGPASLDPDVDDFSINVREFFIVALAVLIWCHTWSKKDSVFHVKAVEDK